MCVAASTDMQVQMLHVQEWRDDVFSRPHSVEFEMLLIMLLVMLKSCTAPFNSAAKKSAESRFCFQVVASVRYYRPVRLQESLKMKHATYALQIRPCRRTAAAWRPGVEGFFSPSGNRRVFYRLATSVLCLPAWFGPWRLDSSLMCALKSQLRCCLPQIQPGSFQVEILPIWTQITGSQPQILNSSPKIWMNKCLVIILSDVLSNNTTPR